MEPVQIIQDTVRGFLESLISSTPQIVAAIIALVLTWAIARFGGRLLRRALGRSDMRRSLADVLQKLFSTLVWIGGILVAATIAFPSLTPAKIVTAVGLGSIAIGFAFKDIFENFVAGILILFREPFRLNDFIECDDFEGVVEEVTIRDTHIRQSDGQRVVLPNAMLFKEPVTVRTDRDVRRTTVMCGVGYGEDVDAAREVICKAVEGVESVRQDEPVQIFAQAFGASSIDFEVTWWTGSKPREIRESRDQVVAAVKRALDDAGIEIPFPYRTLTFTEPLAVHQTGDSHRSRERDEAD
ncbi:MAG: mechanosensitive ion channel [Alphaproteobacteria bacterium]|nr:mechanosensitive ion channel [Alphaproteobacteria bacterium]